MTKFSPLDDPDYRRFAWRRYRRLMIWMVGLAVLSVAAAFAFLLLSDDGVGVSIHMLIATALGVLFTVLLGAALMGLVFLSSGSGHDEAIDDRLEEEFPHDDQT